MLLDVDALVLLSGLAYLVLAAAAVVLWRRSRSLASALVAIGFAMVLTGHLALLIQEIQISAIMRGHPIDTVYLVPHHALWRFVDLIGLWFAAVGLVSYVHRLSERSRVS